MGISMAHEKKIRDIYEEDGGYALLHITPLLPE